MKNSIFVLALSSLLLAGCKPTPRTAHAPKEAETPTQAESAATESEELVEVVTIQPEESQPTPGLLEVSATRQDYNRLRPWEKGKPNNVSFKGVYLGGGRVLTLGRAARNATYIELSLPDQSRTVPARVLRYDDTLDLALVTVEHSEDASIFDGLTAHEVGEPLQLGSTAELWTMVQGITPTHVGVEAESLDDSEEMPHLALRSQKSLPSGLGGGLPILKGGRVVGLVDTYDSSEQALSCINAELISRFLDESTTPGNTVPMMGVAVTRLNDPVFNKYLKLSPNQGGIYVSEVNLSGSAYAAGIRAGDVITSIDGAPLDKQGRWQHPLYGLMDARQVVQSLKPVGKEIVLGVSRNGEVLQISVPLNRDAAEKALLAVEKPGVAPRYIMWGGLLFQPLTQVYLNELRSRTGGLPSSLLVIKDRSPELMAEGRKEIVALTLVIPTPATLGYDGLGFCMVEKVNGKIVRTFDEFAELLDSPTEDGLVELTINRAPYTIYLDRAAVEASNDAIRRRMIPQLRYMGEGPAK